LDLSHKRLFRRTLLPFLGFRGRLFVFFFHFDGLGFAKEAEDDGYYYHEESEQLDHDVDEFACLVLLLGKVSADALIAILILALAMSVAGVAY
jgi:hypothetical protein